MHFMHVCWVHSACCLHVTTNSRSLSTACIYVVASVPVFGFFTHVAHLLLWCWLQ
jgi:hypothetical protein